MEQVEYSISRVERETGISKDMLRMWERRYGFPLPVRMANGVRAYSAQDIERLLRIKKLVNLGHRPGKLVELSITQLDSILALPAPTIKCDTTHGEVVVLLQCLRDGQLSLLEQKLKLWLLRYGLEAFVSDLLPDLLGSIGDSWQTGEVPIHQEHLLTELLQNQLRRSLTKLPKSETQSPKVLLTTLPSEQHGLGLLMLEVFLTLEGAYCINLGVQTPVESIAQAVLEYQVDIVCLSLSEAVIPKLGQQQLKALDSILDEAVLVWLGGVGAVQVKPKSARFVRQQSINESLAALQAWRLAH